MLFGTMLFIMFACYIAENDKMEDKIRSASFGILVAIVVLYIIFGMLL